MSTILFRPQYVDLGMDQVGDNIEDNDSGIILGKGSANNNRRYRVISSLIGWFYIENGLQEKKYCIFCHSFTHWPTGDVVI